MSERTIFTEDDFREPHAPPKGLEADGTMPGLPPLRPTSPRPVASVSRGANGAQHVAVPATFNGGTNLLVDPRTSFLLAAAAGVILAWGVTQLLGIGQASFFTSNAAADRATGVWTGAIGLLYGSTLLAFDAVVAGAWEAAAKRVATAAVPLFGVGFAAGYAANALYLSIIESITSLTSANDVRLYLARIAGWAVFGLGVGVTIGLVSKSQKRAINGAIGGVIGGAAGGLVFQAVGANLHASDGVSRLLGLVGVGALIAIATRVVDTVRREAWINVLAGGMAGKEFILFHAITRIGASPDCEIFLLKDPGVAKLHAQIEDRTGERLLTAAPGAPVYVNGSEVATRTLCHGDQVQIGGTLLGYSERAVAAAAWPAWRQGG